MKDPDVFYDAIQDAVRIELAESGLSAEEQEAIKGIREEKYMELAGKWLRYGGYIDFELDTEAGTLRIMEANE